MKLLGSYPPRAEIAEFPKCSQCGATMIGFAPVYQHVGGQEPDVPFRYCPDCVEQWEREFQDVMFDIEWHRQVVGQEANDIFSLGLVKLLEP